MKQAMSRSRAERLFAQAVRLNDRLTMLVGAFAVQGQLNTEYGHKLLIIARKSDCRSYRRLMAYHYREVR